MKKIDKEKYYHEFLNRCTPLLTDKGVNKLRSSTVAIAGCGGAGGAFAITMARMGVGKFKLADPGIFDPPDVNRQWAANVSNLGRRKTDAYKEMLQNINPQANVKTYPEGITDNNVADFLEGVDLAIDCLDIDVSSALRGKLHGEAHKKKIYSMTAPILSFGTIFCCASPEGMPMDVIVKMVDKGGSGAGFPKILRRIFMPQHLDIIESRIHTHKIPSVPVSSMVSASMLATEGVLALLGKTMPGGRKPVCLPKVIVADFFRLSYQIVDIENIPLDK